jgi:hypothetical protein
MVSRIWSFENSSDKTVSVLLNSVTQTAKRGVAEHASGGTGAHSLQASYPGNTFTLPAIEVPVCKPRQATTLAFSAAGPATTAETVQLVASLSPFAYSGLTTNGETVTFMDSGTLLGTAPRVNGTATLSARVLKSRFSGSISVLCQRYEFRSSLR